MIRLKTIILDNLNYLSPNPDGTLPLGADSKKDRWEYDHAENVGLVQAASPIDESSIISGQPFKYLYKELESSLNEFFSMPSSKIKNYAKKYDWIHGRGAIFEDDIILPVKLNGVESNIKISFKIFPSKKYDDIDSSGVALKSKAYFKKISDIEGIIVVYLDTFFSSLKSRDEYDSRTLQCFNDSVRKLLAKPSSEKTDLLSTLKHEASHAIKFMIYGMAGDQNAYKKALGNKSISLLNYSEIGDEQEAILAEISGQIQQFAKHNKNATFYQTINSSISMRKLILAMLDVDRIDKDKNSNFTLMFKNNKLNVSLNTPNAFDSDVIKYILPKYQAKFKTYIKKLSEWWKQTYPKRLIK